MAQVLRIIDANANRAREALRVMEEAARFILDRSDLTQTIKSLRHDLATALADCPPCQGMIAHRDTPGDVGTTLTTPGEHHRASAAQVVIAAGKRLSEALRAMEEYAKTLGEPGATLAGRVEAIRYRGYDVEQALHLAMMGGQARQWRLCVLITESLCPHGQWLAVAQAAIEGGADCLQLREKDLSGREWLGRARQLVALARPRGVSVIINDRPDVALLAQADGVHLGQDDLPACEVRKLAGDRLIVGVSTSHLEQARQAQRDGADYCGVGPMFSTTTKHKDVIVGPDYLREYVAWNGLPHLAIGGIHGDTLPALIDAGVQGVAVSAAVCAAADPAQATRALRKALPA